MKILVTTIINWAFLCGFTILGLVSYIQVSQADTHASLQSLEEQVNKKPNDKRLLSEYGKALYRAGDKTKALEILKRAIVESDPGSYLRVAQIYREQKNYLDEVRILNLMIPKHPNYPKGYVLLGNAYVKLGKLDEAIGKFRKAIDISPKYESAHWGLYSVYNEKKNNYESRIILLDLVKYFGEKPKYLNPLCKLYSVDSFFDDSIAFCQKAIQLAPKYPDNHIYLALTYKYAKNTQQAEKIIKTAAAQFGQSEFAQQTAGEITSENENWEQATKYFQACVKLNSKSLPCLMGLAKASFSIGKYDLSNKSYFAACQIDRTTVTEFKRSAGVLRVNKKTNWFKKFTDNITKCY